MKRTFTVEIDVECDYRDPSEIQDELVKNIDRIFGFGIKNVEVQRVDEQVRDANIVDPLVDLIQYAFDSLDEKRRTKVANRRTTQAERIKF